MFVDDTPGVAQGISDAPPAPQPSLLRRLIRFLFGWERRRAIRRALTGKGNPGWCRVVMDRETLRLVGTLGPAKLDVLEISGNDKWKGFGFGSYKVADYPAFDICKDVLAERFDLIIAEQVLEHVEWPLRACRNVLQMLRPRGHFLVSTPFLIRVHDYPIDLCRWTELGLKNHLIESGFSAGGIQTGSWGNRAAVVGNFKEFVDYCPWKHSLANEPNFPLVVWALARKD